MKSLPRWGRHQGWCILKKEKAGGQDGPDAQQVYGDIGRLENKTNMYVKLGFFYKSIYVLYAHTCN